MYYTYNRPYPLLELSSVDSNLAFNSWLDITVSCIEESDRCIIVNTLQIRNILKLNDGLQTNLIMIFNLMLMYIIDADIAM